MVNIIVTFMSTYVKKLKFHINDFISFNLYVV